jgi:hypothetical protein
MHKEATIKSDRRFNEEISWAGSGGATWWAAFVVEESTGAQAAGVGLGRGRERNCNEKL